MKTNCVQREYQVVAEEETIENTKHVVYGIVMTEKRNETIETQRVSSISTDLKFVSDITERIRSGEVEIVHFRDIIIDLISEI